MIKNKLDYKLVNLAIIALIMFLVYQTGNLWLGVLALVFKIILPFVLAFAFAYALYPLVKYMERFNIKKKAGTTIVIVGLMLIITFIISAVVPLLYDQMSSLFTNIIEFINKLSKTYEFDLGTLQVTLSQTFDEIVKEASSYLSNGAFSIISSSLEILTVFVIVVAAAIYFLLDFDDIRTGIKKYLHKKSNRSFNYFKMIDGEMTNYIEGFGKIMVIAFVEYTLAFTIIGHPNALLLGVLSVFANLIPYFGGLLINFVAIITSFVIGPALFVRTLVTTFILSILDGYVINPAVYGKTNKLHPLVLIFAIFAGGILMGPLGIIISLPVVIILIASYRFFKKDITDRIEDLKEDIKENKKENKKENSK